MPEHEHDFYPVSVVFEHAWIVFTLHCRSGRIFGPRGNTLRCHAERRAPIPRAEMMGVIRAFMDDESNGETA